MTDSSSSKVETMKLELIDDWKHAWKLYSVHAMLVAAILGVAETALAANHITWIPAWGHGVITTLIAVSGIVARVVKQDSGDAARIEELKQ